MRNILDTAMKSRDTETYLCAAVSTFLDLGWLREHRLARKMQMFYLRHEIEKLMYLRAVL